MLRLKFLTCAARRIALLGYFFIAFYFILFHFAISFSIYKNFVLFIKCLAAKTTATAIDYNWLTFFTTFRLPFSLPFSHTCIHKCPSFFIPSEWHGMCVLCCAFFTRLQHINNKINIFAKSKKLQIFVRGLFDKSATLWIYRAAAANTTPLSSTVIDCCMNFSKLCHFVCVRQPLKAEDLVNFNKNWKKWVSNTQTFSYGHSAP